MLEINHNLLLAALRPEVRTELQPHLHPVTWRSGDILFDVGDTVKLIYFPLDAIISLVVGLSNGEFVEAAMVGRDGVVCGPSALGAEISINRAIVQIPGSGMYCDAKVLKRIALKSEALLSLLVRHEQTVQVQSQQSAACNATHHVGARLARWLLRAHDLTERKTLPFTQEFLAEMMGVRRTSVTVVAHSLQQAGVIRTTRGKIEITDLEGLQNTACECYAVVKKQQQELLGYVAEHAV